MGEAQMLACCCVEMMPAARVPPTSLWTDAARNEIADLPVFVERPVDATASKLHGSIGCDPIKFDRALRYRDEGPGCAEMVTARRFAENA